MRVWLFILVPSSRPGRPAAISYSESPTAPTGPRVSGRGKTEGERARAKESRSGFTVVVIGRAGPTLDLALVKTVRKPSKSRVDRYQVARRRRSEGAPRCSEWVDNLTSEKPGRIRGAVKERGTK